MALNGNATLASPYGGGVLVSAETRRGSVDQCFLKCNGYEAIEKSCRQGTKCSYHCDPAPRIDCVPVGPRGWR